jgi:serine/threonine protein kinase
MGITRSRPASSSSSVCACPDNLTFDEEPEVTSRPSPSIIYDTDGEYSSIPNTYNSKPLFRKMYPDDNEMRVARILQAHPHPNVVEIYHVCDEYIDMELVQTGVPYNLQDIERAHEYFLKHNIVYMDWKPDNFGIDLNGITKVFDFDSSGMFDKETDTWVYCPPNYFSMRHATEAGHINPSDVDRFTFEERHTIWH